MLHGSGPGVSAWSNFRHNLPVFAEHFRVIMPDLPGFGASSLPEFKEVYSLDAARRIAGLMDHPASSRHCSSAIRWGRCGGRGDGRQSARPGRADGDHGFGWALAQPVPDRTERGLPEAVRVPAGPDPRAMTEWVRTMLFDQALVTDERIDERMANATADGVCSPAMPRSSAPRLSRLPGRLHTAVDTPGQRHHTDADAVGPRRPDAALRPGAFRQPVDAERRAAHLLPLRH